MSAFRANNKGYQIKTPYGYEPFAGISMNGVKPVIKLSLSNGKTITGTENHILFTSDKLERCIGNIKIDDVLDGIVHTTVTGVVADGSAEVFDVIEVPSHTFYANSVVSHNCHFISNDPLLFSSIGLSNYFVTEMPAPDARGIVFFEPIEYGNTYLIAMDPATGTGSDYTVIVMYSFPDMVQIAEYRANTVSSPAVYHVLKYLLKLLEKSRAANAYWSLENNGVGEGIISMYESDENPAEFGELVSEAGRRRIGFTTGKNKAKHCMTFKNLFEAGKIIVRSRNTISEMKNYIRKNGSYAARVGSTDDTISAHLILIRILEEITSYEDQAYDIMYKDEFLNEFDNNEEQWEEPAPIVTSNDFNEADMFKHLEMW
jgi:hypothetical protein